MILNWVFRYSLLATLSAKFKSSLKKVINKYSIAPKVEYTYFNFKTGRNLTGVLASYPTKEFFNKKKKKFAKSSLLSVKLLDFSKVKSKRTSTLWLVSGTCAVTGCYNNAQETYYVKKLARCVRNVFFSPFNSYLLQAWKVIESVSSRKQVFLCKNCYRKTYLGKTFTRDFDFKLVFCVKDKL